MLPTPPPFTPQQRISNDFQQYPQAAMMADALRRAGNVPPTSRIPMQPYMDPRTGTYKGAQVASNVLPIPGMAGQAPAWQPTDDQLMRGENLSKHPGTGVLPFPLPDTAALTNIYQQNPPLRR